MKETVSDKYILKFLELDSHISELLSLQMLEQVQSSKNVTKYLLIQQYKPNYQKFLFILGN